MRHLFRLALFFALALAVPAGAQVLTVAALSTTAKAPAKPASTIIPGSPLAALTGGPSPPGANADASVPAPFGTSAIGFSLTRGIGLEATRSFGDFVAAIRQSTRLGPVLGWLRGFSGVPLRAAHLRDIAMALLTTLLPGLLVEQLLRLGLIAPRRMLAGRAMAYLPAHQVADEAEQGLADAEAGETDSPPHRRLSLRAWARRAILALLHLGLCLAPLLGFALTIQGALSAGLVTQRSGHLAVVGITNAYLVGRIALEALRFLVAPRTAGLRLVHLPEARAQTIMAWGWTLLATSFVGYVMVSVSEVLGLTPLEAAPLVRLIALVVHLELAFIIWQSRRVVGGWIAGRPGSNGSLRGFRRRLAGIWYIPALFYILALWVALAAGVHNAFVVLLRIVLVAAAALLIGRMAWHGSATLLERALPDPARNAHRHSPFIARARAYHPLLRSLIRGFIAVLVLVLILQGWGVNAFGWLLTNPLSRSLIGAFIDILITVAVALLLWEVTNGLMNGRIERLSATGRTRQAARLHTLLPMLKASIGVSIFLVAGLICLSKIGVNAAPLLAGAGVLGIAIGFGSQKLVQDIITGLFLLLEDAMQVGDSVSLAGMSGTVERLSIRTIRLRGGDGSVNIIPFSAVTTVTNMTRDFSYAQLSIQVGYKEDLSRVYAVLTDIAFAMRKEASWGAMIRDDLQLFGLDQFGPSSLVITGQIRTGPGQHWGVRREFYARVKHRFETENIEIPYSALVRFAAEEKAAPG